MNEKTETLLLWWFVPVYTIAMFFWFFFVGNYEFLLYVVTVGVLLCLILYSQKRYPDLEVVSCQEHWFLSMIRNARAFLTFLDDLLPAGYPRQDLLARATKGSSLFP